MSKPCLLVLLLQEELRGIKRMQDAHNAALAAEDALMEADPFDPEAQRKIEELIQRKNIEENFAAVRNKGWWGRPLLGAMRACLTGTDVADCA